VPGDEPSPSGVNAMLKAVAWPSRVTRGVPFARSHSTTLNRSSPDAYASVRPSGTGLATPVQTIVVP
jgi:hypothetical protein